MGVGSRPFHTSEGGEGRAWTCGGADPRTVPLIRTKQKSKELLNVSNSSRALCVDPEIPWSVIRQTVEISMVVRNTSASPWAPLSQALPLLSAAPRAPPCSLHAIQSGELGIQFSSQGVERSAACHLLRFALCLPPQGRFARPFDLWLWFGAVTDFFVVVAAAATVSLQLDF